MKIFLLIRIPHENKNKHNTYFQSEVHRKNHPSENLYIYKKNNYSDIQNYNRYPLFIEGTTILSYFT